MIPKRKLGKLKAESGGLEWYTDHNLKPTDLWCVIEDENGREVYVAMWPGHPMAGSRFVDDTRGVGVRVKK